MFKYKIGEYRLVCNQLIFYQYLNLFRIADTEVFHHYIQYDNNAQKLC